MKIIQETLIVIESMVLDDIGWFWMVLGNWIVEVAKPNCLQNVNFTKRSFCLLKQKTEKGRSENWNPSKYNRQAGAGK